ncbi:MurR/RpiR family transcriptional regulator [Companilactobacillus nantensis]|uniref:RpiR family transcriptional regulator n=1 Tax=Companilactobacillus nantensis DSM 16982 TaxID=1423774 RepID=A0A0R1W8Y4_9LACO|nr:MurR/RpiR family transcriptional regulator [Companilactobacillus nantensis]KRM14250.1 RpiR family transcriptional regulator [Companilactobacillus nantensis DSM 16982]GEO65393.1 RpiR family transcriptional regulator [Companilactobacillus nantensis]
MLLQEKIDSTNFSANEQIVVDFIEHKQETINDYSTTKIAKETYTSPSVLVRIAKKLGFNGWTELKNAYVEELTYLHKHFKNIDANIPFSGADSVTSIANKLGQLKNESILDTLSLIDSESLSYAIELLDHSNNTGIFGLSNIIFQAEEFSFKMRHIGSKVQTFPIQNTMFQEAAMMNLNDCAIFISYSGESDPLFTVINILKHNHVPIIAITSIGDNKLSKLADITLRISTRERSYTKIAGFASQESISLILDILYSGYFAQHFDDNYNYKISLSQQTEFRDIDNHIIRDNQ